MKDINSELTPPADETAGPPPTHETPQEIITIKKPETAISLKSIFVQDKQENGVWQTQDEEFVKVKNKAKDPVFKLKFWKSTGDDKKHAVIIENIEGYSTRVFTPETGQSEEELQYSFDENNQRLKTSLPEDKSNITPDELSDHHRYTQLIEVTSQESGEKSYFLFTSYHHLNPAKDLGQTDIHRFSYAVTPVETQ